MLKSYRRRLRDGMKVRLNFYKKESQKDILKQFIEMWRDHFNEYEEVILRGLARALRPIESQLRTVLERERVESEIAFDVWVEEQKYPSREEETTIKRDVLCFQIYLSPDILSKKLSALWIRFGGKIQVPFPVFDLINDKDKVTSQEVVEQFVYDRARLVSSDIAREGIPKEMKQDIGEIKRLWSKLKFNNFDQVEYEG